MSRTTIDQTDEEILTYEVADEAVEVAACAELTRGPVTQSHSVPV
jgi:hypothetical protein